jgi:autotransporter-associated beta strand protein/parallel beta-helix repeat protein
LLFALCSLLPAILSLLAAASAAKAAIYYVAPTGSDGGPGTAAQPWLTLQNAMNNVQAGDTVDVAAGNYAGFVDGWDTPISGTPSAPITFNAAPGAVIDARNNRTPDGIDLEPGCNDIVIEGFTIQNPAGGTITRAGIRVTGSDNVVVQNNLANNCGTWGIFTSHANYVLVQGNTASNSQKQHGIYISNASVGPVVRGNTAFNNYGSGIQFNGDLSQGGTGLISNAVVEGNVVYNNGAAGGAALNCDGLQSSLIQGNLLYGNHASGIALFDIDAAAGSIKNQVVNNTIINAADSKNAIEINSGSTGNTLLNNIIHNQNPTAGHGAISITSDSLPGLVSNSNLIDPRLIVDDTSETIGQWQASTGNDTHSAPIAYFGNTLTVSGSSAATFGGTIADFAGAVALVKSGSGTLVLWGTNTFTGGTTVTDGTLVFTNVQSIADGTDLTVAAGGSAVFGTSLVSRSTAVPEPGTLVLSVASILLVLVVGRVERRRSAREGDVSGDRWQESESSGRRTKDRGQKSEDRGRR